MERDKLERKIKRRKRLLGFCMFVIFCGLIAGIALKSSYFSINNIIIKNNKFVTREEILAMCDAQGQNIFLIKGSAIREKICNNPYVESVQIVRKLPSTLILDIKEKKVKGLIRFQNAFINLDSQGNMIQTVNQFPDGTLPLIEGITVKQYAPGQSIVPDKPVMQNALKAVLTVTDFSECANRFYSIDIHDPYDIILTTRDGMQIKIGDWTNIDYKLSYALSILNNPAVKGYKGIIEIEPEGTAVFKKN